MSNEDHDPVVVEFEDAESLLAAIDEARLPSGDFRKRDWSAAGEKKREEELTRLVCIAQDLGVYPRETMEGNPNSVQSMVRGWGARWFEFRGPFECPHCGIDLRSPLGPPFKLEIGIYDESRDCTIYFKCPDCEKRI
jgi:predicted RNA-binding Zn-ribbon protein involved in translation (DUF1610 family)